MKSLKRYTVLARLKLAGHYVSLECDALNPSQECKIMAQTHNIMRWVQQPNKKQVFDIIVAPKVTQQTNKKV